MVKRPNIAVILTSLRLTLAPFIFYYIFISKTYTALILFGIAILTDISDGYFARKQNKTTRFGKILDPIADKTLYGWKTC